MEENFLIQPVRESAREDAPLDMLFGNRKGLLGDVVVVLKQQTGN